MATAALPDVDQFLAMLAAVHVRAGRLTQALHAPFGVTAALRPVLLMLLAEGSALTLSEIATTRGVSRQFVHKLVTPLVAKGLVAVDANPRHKGSPKVRLTAWGRRVIQQAQKREAAVIEAIAAALDADALATACDVLDRLDGALAGAALD